MTNPTYGKRGGQPETGMLPRSRGGAASVTTTPRTSGQTDRLRTYLLTKTRQQYEARIRTETAKLGVQLTGQVADPAVMFQLAQRAGFASQSITDTAARQIATAQRNGGSVQGLIQTRNGYKPEQIWATELGTADHAAFTDFYANNPVLADQITAHVEPTDAAEEICQQAIDAGSIPISSITIDFPAHVGCDHGYVTDDPPADPLLTDTGVTASSATAEGLALAGFWVAGMTIAAAATDIATSDDGGGGEEASSSTLLTEARRLYAPL